VWHEGGSCHYIMFATPEGATAPRRYRVDSFPVGSRLLNALMGGVMEGVTADEQLRRKLYQVNIHTTLSGEAMVTLIYHRQLDDAWAAAAAGLRERLRPAAAAAAALDRRHAAGGGGNGSGQEQQQRAAAADGGGGGGGGGGGDQRQVLHIIGRSRKQKVALDADFVTERLAVNGRELAYK
jgi:hypothetical protein